MKIVFAGTPAFALPSLAALLSEHEVVTVYTQPDRASGRGKKLTASPVKLLAQEHRIPVLQPTSLRDQVDALQEMGVDVMVVVAYGLLLPSSILEIPRLGCLNIHASLLPRWRGAAPIQRAIEAGDQNTGISIMQMERGLDTGPVFLQRETPINPDDTSASLHDRLSHVGAVAICDTLAALAKNQAPTPEVQDETLATYAAKISKGEATIDWHNSAERIQRRVRAFIPWPVSTTTLQGERLRIWQTVCRGGHSDAAPGTIVAVATDALSVQCGEGQLQLQKLQRDGGKPLPYHEFKNGFAFEVGQRFS